jgi:hypothetical protein
MSLLELRHAPQYGWLFLYEGDAAENLEVLSQERIAMGL